MKPGHGNRYFCGAEGYLFSGYVQSGTEISADIVIGPQHQGWPDIPHGGVGMTAVLELSHLLDAGSLDFPFIATYRFGGDRLFINDGVRMTVSADDGLMRGSIMKKGGVQPYMTFVTENGLPPDAGEHASSLWELARRPVINRSAFIMPNFSNRLIYGPHHQWANRRREFCYQEADTGTMYMSCVIPGTEESASEAGVNCLTPGSVHPGVIATVLDETLAWSGFFASWQGGVTTDLTISFLKPMNPAGRFFTIGRCDTIYGAFSRKLVSCSGGVFMKCNGMSGLVATAAGRWLTRPEYKDEMLRYFRA